MGDEAEMQECGGFSLRMVISLERSVNPRFITAPSSTVCKRTIIHQVILARLSINSNYTLLLEIESLVKGLFRPLLLAYYSIFTRTVRLTLRIDIGEWPLNYEQNSLKLRVRLICRVLWLEVKKLH